MSFKGYSKGFAQAVNELVPETEEIKMTESIEKDEILMVDSLDEKDMLENIPEVNKIDELPAEDKKPVSRANVKAAVTEAMTEVESKPVYYKNSAPASGIEEIKQEPVIGGVEEIDETPKVQEIEKREVSFVSGMEIRDNNGLAGNPNDNTAYITEVTIINGDLETSGNIDITGRINGNVICRGKLVVSGTIMGDINTKELYANEASIEGEIIASDEVSIGSGTVLVGNISAGSATIAGAVNGDIDVQGPVIVDSTAVIIGNIKSKSVQVNSGAVVEGFCSQSYSDIDAKSFFPKQGN